MNPPLVSVIIPARDPAWLDEAVDSVAAQTVRDLELIVVDDGSRLPLSVRSRSFPVAAARLEPGRGPAAARNAGLARASGRYAAFLDADDLWKPFKLERQLEAMDAPGIVWCYSAAEPLEPAAPSREAYPVWSRLGIPLPFPPTSSVMVRADELRRAGGFDERLRVRHEDTDLWARLWERSGPAGVRVIETALVCRRRHAGQLSAAADPVERRLDELLFSRKWRARLP